MSSSPATGAASSSSASAPAATSASSSAMPRGGVALGLPAHPRAPQTPVGYTGFVPPPTLAAQFGSMHRGPDQPPPSSTQVSWGSECGMETNKSSRNLYLADKAKFSIFNSTISI
ncbi:hypothetical protein [Oryza sativa Japonica Group]|uniref:Uncharacterized protein n=1 Tax=Oryza sativa subsp. japonica TaxID=39947 RepID=Q5N901_ORYSJ|nr:hypothetical protein [Oryza sativa Japonica Group]